MGFQSVFGGEQSVGDHRRPVFKTMDRHRHRDRHRVAERIVQSDAGGADAEGVCYSRSKATPALRAALRSVSSKSSCVSVFGVRAV